MNMPVIKNSQSAEQAVTNTEFLLLHRLQITVNPKDPLLCFVLSFHLYVVHGRIDEQTACVTDVVFG